MKKKKKYKLVRKKRKHDNRNNSLQVYDKKKKTKFSERHPKLALFIKLFLIIFVMLIVIGTAILTVAIIGILNEEDAKITLEDLSLTGNSLILDSNNNVIAELSGDEYRKIIKLEDMADYLPKAYVAIEDERFYDHQGVDFKRTGGAIFTFILHKGDSSFGGSTITQQLVKNITQDDDRSGVEGIKRKIREWVKAYQVEQMLSKEQILELYLNVIYIGGGKNYHGVEIGAEFYFGKTAKELDLIECAFLAGINSAPNAYNPYGEKSYENDEAKKKKIDNKTKVVLGKMLELGSINKEEYDEAVKTIDENGLKFQPNVNTGNIYSYHTDATISKVISDLMEIKGWSKEYATTYLYGGGITIYSTQDVEVQSQMEKVMQEDASKYSKKGTEKNDNDEYEYSQAASVVIDNKTGYAVGIVGGLGEKTESRGLNRATQSPRQTGSSFKPIADVLPALEEGLINAATMYNDCAVEFPMGKGQKPFTPQDEGSYRGIISVRSAITTSQNVPFVKIMAELTNETARKYLKKMGITTISDTNDTGLSLAIGGQYIGVTTYEMAAAYAAIENDGVYREPLLYTKIVDSQGNVVIEKEQKTERVCSEQNAYILKDMLKSVVNASNGTAKICKIAGMDVAAKTGTTNDRKDRWLCGFTDYYTAATWYGYDTPQYIKITGNNPAAQIFIAFMAPLHKGKENSSFEKPEDIVTVKVCSHTGLKATDKCSETYNEIFVKGTEPKACTEKSSYVEICNESGMIATEFCPNYTVKYYAYEIEKEKLKLWTNKGKNDEDIPKDKCNIHTAENSLSNALPVISLNGDQVLTLKIGDKYEEQGATAIDKTDGDITNKIKIEGKVNTSVADTYQIKYTVENSKGYKTEMVRKIIVEDPTPKPVEVPKIPDEDEKNTQENETKPEPPEEPVTPVKENTVEEEPVTPVTPSDETEN